MNDQDFERGLSEALRQASSELPENTHRYQDVRLLQRRQAKRRHRVVGGLAAAAAVTAIAIGSGPMLQGLFQNSLEPAMNDASGAAGSAPNEQLDAESDRSASADSAKLRAWCPERPKRLGDPEPTGAGRFVPAGAVTARLCGPERESVTEMSRSDEVLERGIDELVSALNALPAYGKDDCAGDGSELFDLVLGYPDGSRVVVTFDSQSCGVARAGEHYRKGASGLDDTSAPEQQSAGLDIRTTFEELLREQKSND